MSRFYSNLKFQFVFLVKDYLAKNLFKSQEFMVHNYAYFVNRIYMIITTTTAIAIATTTITTIIIIKRIHCYIPFLIFSIQYIFFFFLKFIKYIN